VGSELLRGKINTHVSTLARTLASIGLELSAERTVGDDPAELTRLIHQALQESAIVLVTGGLGPTFDDVTREAAAEACGRRLVVSRALLRDIERKFRKAKYRHMPPANQRQADLIEGARAILNKVGTAPGQWLDLGSRVLILLPGPPSELNPMLEDSVLPLLKKTFPAIPVAEAHLHFVGVPESIVDDRIRPIIAEEEDVQFTILAHLGLVDFDIFVSDPSRPKACRRLARIVRKIRAVMGQAFYGMDRDYPLEKIIAEVFTQRKATLSVAESCTGGMLAKRLTDIAGSSSYFQGGVISYSNAVKNVVLSVPEATIRKHGAVSREVALAMASGIRTTLCSTWGLGITGIAGPSGGTPAKPVGLVYLGLEGPGIRKTLEMRFRGSRDAIRQRAVIAALDLLRQIYL